MWATRVKCRRLFRLKKVLGVSGFASFPNIYIYDLQVKACLVKLIEEADN